MKIKLPDVVNDSPVKGGEYHFVLKCKLGVTPMRRSFTSRSLTFRNAYRLSEGGDHYDAAFSSLRASLNAIDFSDFAQRDDFHILNGFVPPQIVQLGFDPNLARGLGPTFPEVAIEWHDSHASSLQQLILILAGAIFGLAGAFLVEWVKATIERASRPSQAL